MYTDALKLYNLVASKVTRTSGVGQGRVGNVHLGPPALHPDDRNRRRPIVAERGLQHAQQLEVLIGCGPKEATE